jgi:hypothetical protein
MILTGSRDYLFFLSLHLTYTIGMCFALDGYAEKSYNLCIETGGAP